nr:MAG TPA: hypothetical protein [Caudoviricetes sp.]
MRARHTQAHAVSSPTFLSERVSLAFTPERDPLGERKSYIYYSL